MAGTIVEKDTEFSKLLQHCKCVAKDNTKEYKQNLGKVLESIYVLDQSTRSMSDLAINITVGANKSQITSQLILDSVYAIYGWLSESEVGSKGSVCQFLIIQYSGLQTLKKWIPALQKAVNNCQLAPEYLAMMKDRILVFTGKKNFMDHNLNLVLRWASIYHIQLMKKKW